MLIASVDLDSGNGILPSSKKPAAPRPFLELYPGCEVEIGAYTIVYEEEADVERLPQLVLIAGGEQLHAYSFERRDPRGPLRPGA